MSEEERVRRALDRRPPSFRTSRRSDGRSYSHPVSGNAREDYLRAAMPRQAQQSETDQEQEPVLTCWRCGQEITGSAYQREDGRVYCKTCRDGIRSGELQDVQNAVMTDSTASTIPRTLTSGGHYSCPYCGRDDSYLQNDPESQKWHERSCRKDQL